MIGVGLWSKKNILKENQRSDKEDVYANSKEYFTAKSCQLGCSKNAKCEKIMIVT